MHKENMGNESGYIRVRKSRKNDRKHHRSKKDIVLFGRIIPKRRLIEIAALAVIALATACFVFPKMFEQSSQGYSSGE